jgi:hypothetical protein
VYEFIDASAAGWELADRANVSAQALIDYRTTLNRNMVAAAIAQTE